MGSTSATTMPRAADVAEPIALLVLLHHRGTGYSLTRHDRHGAYSDVGRIRADDPVGGKQDLSPLIERGTRLCR